VDHRSDQFGVDRIAASLTVATGASKRSPTPRLEHNTMHTAYAVRTLPARDPKGDTIGWVRGDVLADGTQPTDLIILRDGSACGQAEAAFDLTPACSIPTPDEAVRDGIARLRAADAIDGRRANSK
jgi:hypothetical protein